jgi:predicted transcriptional regulator
MWRERRSDKGVEPLGRVSGALEERVLGVVWRVGQASVRDVLRELEEPLAYTTIMTTLDRLFRKGVLARRREGKAYVYWAVGPKVELEGSLLAQVVSRTLGAAGTREPLLSSFVNALSSRDRALLDELEQAVRERRRALKRRGK